MGCSESKIDNVRIVNQSKDRIALMKQSVSAYAAFVSAYFSFTSAHKNIGVTLCDYAQSELQSSDDQPLPPHPPLQHNGIYAWDFFVQLMEDDHGYSSGVVNDKHGGVEKLTIGRKVVRIKSGHGGCRVVKDSNGGPGVGEGPPPSSMAEDTENVNLVKIYRKPDDGFIKASKCAVDVSKTHDAYTLHCHSSLQDNQGQSKHSSRAMRVTNSAKVDFFFKDREIHATLLDTMLTWEKKLYDQVKVVEMMKHEYRKKTELLNKLRKRGVSSDRLSQTKTHVHDLHTRYIVEMQSTDSTVLEINRLRDEQLYPKLIQIVEEMEEMWKNMQKKHEQQSTIVQRLSNFKNSQLPNDTSENNLKNIKEIYLQVTIWCSEFEKFMLYQKEYTKSLNNWLKLNLSSKDINVKHQNPRIESLLRTWNDQIEKLPENKAKTAINAFEAVIATIMQHHSTEIKMKQRCNEIRTEITKKTQKFEEWCDKQISKRINTDEMDADVMDDMDMIADQQVVVEALKMWLEEEDEAYQRYRVQVKDTSAMKLKTALPEVFTVMTEFASACLHMYGSLKAHAIGEDRWDGKAKKI
ncbi:hypothetical protein R6Q59_024886 [Mikania micrantha]